ncbi:glycosyltransferase [Limisphaera sp. VF-2]|uniref:glycosyltransferase n=1 Tax=Limisphaera sp. VF-2 TaxID=3400418 RepID=UPI003C24A853
MRICVVIPAFNEERLLGRTLQAVQQASAAFLTRGWDRETIVCDNNSTDATPRIAAAAGARVVFEPVNQIARARNRGAAAATGDWLIFLDADSQPTRALFEEVARVIEAGRAIAGGCTLTMQTSHRVARWILAGWNLLSRMGGWLAGAFIFIETPAFRQLGGFNEALYVAEEIEFTQRLKRLARKAGRPIVILHRHPLLTSDRKVRLYGPGEHLRFWWQALRAPRQTMTCRDACPVWYDGRR